MTDTRPEKPGGKGRPTPKRSEKVAARRKPVVAAKGRDAARSQRNDRAAARRKVREAMRSGDERYYPSVAAGPERALVRDVVDSRRSFGWLAVPGWLVGVSLTLVPSTVVRSIGGLVFPLVVGILVLDAMGASRAVRRALDERWPDGTQATRRSLVWYGIARNTQFRRQRLPRPRVDRGAPLPR